jgi:hypothetical protein
MPFASYRWFQEPSAWRSFASRFDFYLGDRLHGGIVALQTGVPALLIAEDQRVNEIADFFAIPKISVRELRENDLLDILREALDSRSVARMKEVYVERFAEFRRSFATVGIPLTVCLSSEAERWSSRPFIQPVFPRPTRWRRIKDWLVDARG